jgi:alkylhydroperoxidase family enzyme
MNASFRLIHPALVLAAMAASTQAADVPRTADPARTVSAALDVFWPGHPESVDMLADILIKGPRISGGDGWFRKSAAQSRFNWASTRGALDANGDGSLSRAEFPGTDADFARLDRDRSGTLTAADFDFSSPDSAPSPAVAVFGRADRDGNGKITREEVDALFRENDSGGLGFLSLDDLRQALTTPPNGSSPSSGPPNRMTFLKSFFRRELGAFPPGPSLEDDAPDFTLRSVGEGTEVTLSRVVGPKPVVLVFGNFTCGPFRRQGGNLEKLCERYKDRATFLMIYVREPHPIDGWRMDNNDRVGVAVRQPRDYDERFGVAQLCNKTLKLGFPMLVDTMDDAVNNRYSGIPSRLYLIDRRGKIAFKNGRGPFGFNLAELEHSLVLLLQQSSDSPAKPAGSGTGGAVTPPGEERGAMKLLSSEEAWKRLPKVAEGGRPTLPNWARATARDLPRTTAAMLDLDRLHRTKSPLDPALRGKMRWVAADANRCDYTRETAEADLRRAGVPEEQIAELKAGPRRWRQDERAALDFSSQMTLDASLVADTQVADLRADYGDEKLVAMVLLLAAANFQDRLILGLGLPPEAGGPLPPLAVRFDPQAPKPPVPPRADPATLRGPAEPATVDDPEWNEFDFDALKQGMETQKANEGRIRVPTFEEVLARLPAGYPKPARPIRIKWSLVCMGYQPELASAWGACTTAFREEAKQDRVFEESLFWVVTRTIHCFY